MPDTQTLIITPIGPIVNLDVLIDAQVQATVYDCAPFSYQTFIGTITQVKLNKYGTFVYFKTPDLVGGKWLPLSRVIGFAHTEEPAAVVEPVVEVVAPVLPAHQTDKGRVMGKVTHINARAGYGYIYSNGGSYRFDTRSILGMAPVSKGAAVTFASGLCLNGAASIVVTGNAVSEAAYGQWVATKSTAKTARLAGTQKAAV